MHCSMHLPKQLMTFMRPNLLMFYTSQGPLHLCAYGYLIVPYWGVRDTQRWLLHKKVAGQNHFIAKKLEGMYSRPIAREEWSEESSLRKDGLLSLEVAKKGLLFTWNSATALLHILFALCTSAYLITSGCCSTCTNTPSLGEKCSNPCNRTQQQYTQGVRASHHHSRQLSQSFSQGKAELPQFYCSFQDVTSY